MKRSYLVAVGIVFMAVLWMLSGLFLNTGSQAAIDAATVQHSLPQVQVVRHQARPMRHEVRVQGQTRAKYEVDIKAQVPGQVREILADKGSHIKHAEPILRLEADERPQHLAEARALVEQRQLEYEAAKSLQSKGLQAERQLSEAMTLLHSARSQLKSAELNMARLTISAPFDGVIHERHAAVGEYLQVGDRALTLVSLDPLVIGGDLSEQEVDRLETGIDASAELSNGVLLEGHITYIAPVADSATRTYAIELEAANPAPMQRGGMSATIRIPLDTLFAHKISPAQLSLDDKGTLGLKVVDDESLVRFFRVDILKSERDGLWLGGLPESIDLITVGQGFVRSGDKVEVKRGKSEQL